MKKYNEFELKIIRGMVEVSAVDRCEPSQGRGVLATFDVSSDNCPTFDMLPSVAEIAAAIDGISLSSARLVRREIRNYWRNFGPGSR